MGRTVPSFRNALAEEKQEWKPFRNALDKSEKKVFDEMWDIPKLYIMACSGSVSLVPFHPIAISILFHHYKELKERISEVEKIEGGQVNHSKNKEEKWLTIKEEEEEQETLKQKEEILTTLDSYLLY
ncbi:MAG: hypothetical protein M3270_11765 [Thermoproteota archaeon]|nr:hypothetical protein [Thermoproteota archaeon]